MLDDELAPPLGLDGRTTGVEREIFLRSLLNDLEAPVVTARLLALFRDVYFTAGQLVYDVGDASDDLYFLVSGAVQLTATGQATWTFRERSVFGGLDATLARPRTRKATAVAASHAIVISNEEWIEVLEDNFALAHHLVYRMAGGMLPLMLENPAVAYEPLGAEPLTVLPELRRGVVDRLVVLHDSPLFKLAKVQPLIVLARAAAEKRLQDGEVLHTAGSAGDAIYIVADGVIAVTSASPPFEGAYRTGDVVGGAPAIAPEPRALRAHAHGPAIVLALRRADLHDVLEDHFDVVRSLWAYVTIERDRIQRHVHIDG